jgi:hypothetical protein
LDLLILINFMNFDGFFGQLVPVREQCKQSWESPRTHGLGRMASDASFHASFHASFPATLDGQNFQPSSSRPPLSKKSNPNAFD